LIGTKIGRAVLSASLSASCWSSVTQDFWLYVHVYRSLVMRYG